MGERDYDTLNMVAVIGMAVRLPGGIHSPKDMWESTINKRDETCVVPPSRYNINGFHSQTLPYSVGQLKGYFLDEDLALMDAEFFNIPARRAALLDPQQRLLLEVVWECFENAGEIDYAGKDIGCFVGTFGGDWQELVNKDLQHANKEYATATESFSLSGATSHEFDLRGPSITFEEACSASAAALHYAREALRSGECSTAILVGTSLIFSPTMQTQTRESGALSGDGICRSFDAAANGYGRGEAVNAVLLKPVEHELRGRNNIRAVIRATAINCTGGSVDLMGTPGAEAQELLIRRAYQKAGIQVIEKTAFVECHGTGTTVGDAVEGAVVASIFPNGVYMGSAKPNFGHSEGASGVTSIIKIVLALENKIIPPNIHFEVPSPRVPFESGKLVVPIAPAPWPSERDERVSVNNFGIG